MTNKINYIVCFSFKTRNDREKAIEKMDANNGFGYGDITPFLEDDGTKLFFFKLLNSYSEEDNLEEKIAKSKKILKKYEIEYDLYKLYADPYTCIFNKDKTPLFNRFNYVIAKNNDLEMVESLEEEFGRKFECDKEIISFIASLNNQNEEKIHVYRFGSFDDIRVRGLDYVNLSEEQKKSGKYIITTMIA